ncbi:MAG: isoprenoid biosynthesis glyoxalase ElbB [Phycisphaerales bacterium]
MPKVAIILSGCGVFDGSEIHEAVSVLVHLSRHGAEWHCFAPDKSIPEVIDHLKGAPASGEKRNMLTESARIARGADHISALGSLKASDFDALVIPGGFGAAKNLSDFALKGAEFTPLPEVENAIKAFHKAGKPVAACCIAPPLVARAVGGGVKVTVGEAGGAADAIDAVGGSHVVKPVTEACVDESKMVVTAPAYMYGEASPYEVFLGIGEMIDATMAMLPADMQARSR